MKEQKLQIFLDIINNYFKQFANEELVVDTPYILENKKTKVHDYTGVIGISGVQKGVVCFSATHRLLSCVLEGIGESDSSESMFIDLVGEIANTIAGNARKAFGPTFHISVPFVFKGAPQSVVLPKDEHSFVIPIMWQEQVGEIVVCLQD